MLEKTPVRPLDKEIKPISLKGNQPWIFLGKIDAEAETPVFLSSDAISWLIGKVHDAVKDWEQKEKRTSEEEMAGWHHQSNGHELGVNLGRWWETGRPGVLQSTGSQRVRQDWAAEQQVSLIEILEWIPEIYSSGFSKICSYVTKRQCILPLQASDTGAGLPGVNPRSTIFHDLKLSKLSNFSVPHCYSGYVKGHLHPLMTF